MTFNPDKPYKIEMFPPEVTELHTEVRKHPDLLKILHEQPDKDVYIQILEIGKHCGIMILGTYTHEDMINLCKLLTAKLYKMRTIHVDSTPGLIIVPPGN